MGDLYQWAADMRFHPDKHSMDNPASLLGFEIKVFLAQSLYGTWGCRSICHGQSHFVVKVYHGLMLDVSDFQAVDDVVFAVSSVFSDGIWIPLPWRWDYLQFHPYP